MDENILEIGFLSADVNQFVQEHRTTHSNWFSLASRVNRGGQRIMANANVKVTEKGAADPQFIALLLLVRTLSNFQGVVLMIERGMVVEARTLARSCYENVYCLAALQKHGDAFVKKMLADDLASRRATANWLLSHPERLQHAPPDSAERLERNIANIDAISEVAARHVFEQIALSAGIGDLYLFYRQLSWDSAHPSVQALSRYLAPEDAEDRNELWWGPQTRDGEISDTLSICLPAVFGALTIARELLLLGTDPDLESLWTEYKTLTAR